MLLADGNVYEKNCKKKTEIMSFEELRSGLDVPSLLRYASKFGTRHLYHADSTDKANMVTRYDLDIILGPFLALYVLKKIGSFL